MPPFHAYETAVTLEPLCENMHIIFFDEGNSIFGKNFAERNFPQISKLNLNQQQSSETPLERDT